VTATQAQVLVVDDEDSGRFVKTQMLRRAGFSVHEAATGQGALDSARDNAIDLVVLDVNLPDMTGFEVCRQLRTRQPGPPAIQILHVSSTAITDSDRARGLNEGADAYLAEPLEPGVLVATVHALLRVRRAEASLADALTREHRARTDAELANRLKDEFIATLSHELRTPLNALMGWIWQLRQETLSEAGRGRALESLERNARIQAQLINDLLDVSRITKGKLQLQMRVVDMKTVVDSAIEVVRDVASRKQIELRVQTEGMCVAGDEGRLQQIVGNLLNNAIQFTPEGGRIDVTMTRDGDDVVIAVRDTGAGIEPALLPYIFEPFRQGKDGLSRVHGGLGLGLAVVQQLVELHDGTVSVESEGIGRGAMFVIRLPETGLPLPDPCAEDGVLLLSGRSILVAAPTPESRDHLISIIESSGGIVVIADGGEQSKAQDVDIVLRDTGQSIAIADGAQMKLPLTGAAKETIVAKPVRPAAFVRLIAELLLKIKRREPAGDNNDNRPSSIADVR